MPDNEPPRQTGIFAAVVNKLKLQLLIAQQTSPFDWLHWSIENYPALLQLLDALCSHFPVLGPLNLYIRQFAPLYTIYMFIPFTYGWIEEFQDALLAARASIARRGVIGMAPIWLHVWVRDLIVKRWNVRVPYIRGFLLKETILGWWPLKAIFDFRLDGERLDHAIEAVLGLFGTKVEVGVVIATLAFTAWSTSQGWYAFLNALVFAFIAGFDNDAINDDTAP